ncbi:TetR family transcriptional regulator C-terminal domain-containing protein [Micromonospora sp. DPT]|uniref:TetR family transcriptional regulator C-terminal domain-containing protein n=1 Tax=Micromonospora sp. DPT TaxID=3142975 RepID=UPI0032089BCA
MLDRLVWVVSFGRGLMRYVTDVYASSRAGGIRRKPGRPWSDRSPVSSSRTPTWASRPRSRGQGFGARPASPDGGERAALAAPGGRPLTRPPNRADNRIWVSSWDAALADPDLAAGHAARYARSRERIRHHVQAAQPLAELPPCDPDDIAAAVQSFALGLIVQALFGAEEFPPERQLRLLDDYLATLATTARPPR